MPLKRKPGTVPKRVETGWRASLARALDRVGLGDWVRPQPIVQSAAFTTAFVSLAAKMAKADGVAVLAEEAAFERFIEVTAEEAVLVKRLWDLAKEDTAGYELYAERIARLLEDDPQLKTDVFECLLWVACSDGILHASEQVFLQTVALKFGIPDIEYQHMRAYFIRDGSSPYEVLDLAPTATMDEIKARYRALARANHPDRLMGEGACPTVIKAATVKLAAINDGLRTDPRFARRRVPLAVRVGKCRSRVMITPPMIEKPDSPLVERLVPSPNIEPRLKGLTPQILIMHYTGLETVERAIDVLSRPDCKVSCHYVVDEQGRIVQMVAEQHRAWHAGLSFWRGETDINSASIGIEIQNLGHTRGYPDFPARQMEAVAALAADIIARHGMAKSQILAHSDIAPGRKIDPGEKFDWQGLAARGIGHWVDPTPVDACDEGYALGSDAPAVAEAQSLLAAYGYRIDPTGILDEQTAIVLRAFQLHFRQSRPDGRLDGSTLETLRRLVASPDSGLTLAV